MTMTMTLTLGQIVQPLEIWFAVRGVISTVPIWLLATAFYSWTAPLTTAIHVNDAGSDSIGIDHADHANAMDGEDMERSTTAATIGKDDDAMDLESIIANSLSIENDDLLLVNDEEDNNCVEVEGVDKEDMEFNPMGLQLWQNEESLFRALDGGRLILVILVAPWCKTGAAVINDLATSAAELLDDFFLLSSSSNHTNSSFLPLTTTKKPLIGIMDSSNIKDEFIDIFGTVTHYPALKFILTFPDEANDEDVGMNADDVIDNDRMNRKVQIWDYIGPKESAKHLFDSVVMYWYRFAVTYSFLGHVKSSIDDADDESDVINPPIFTFSSQHELTSFLRSHGDSLLRPAQARRKHTSKLESEVFHFYMGMQEKGEVGGIFHPFEYFEEESIAQRTRCNEMDEAVEGALPQQCGESSEFTQEIDPYVVIVQCRSTINYGAIDLTEIAVEELINLNKQRKAMKDFEELAVEMAHRVDVAFFALNATTHNTNNLTHVRGQVCGGLFGEVKDSLVGAVAFVKVRRFVDYSIEDETQGYDVRNVGNNFRRRIIHRIRTDWNETTLRSPHALFFPVADERLGVSGHLHAQGKYSVNNSLTPVKYVQSSLVASSIVHTTPTVLWFDKDRMSQLAFPWYRKVHAVLFVDMGLAFKEQGPMSIHRPPWPKSLNFSTEAGQMLRTQQKAISLFYDAALQHQRDRPSDDVVFLIVPSSEIRIMTVFGIDVWTQLDKELFGTRQSDKDNTSDGSNSDSRDIRSILPVMIITDSSGRFGNKSSGRYYLCSQDIAKKTMEKGGPIGKFINSFFNGTIGKPFLRSSAVPASRRTSQDPPKIIKPNVTVLTGNTFESLVMDRDDEHTMLLLQSNYCGHCKRFSIFWNELSSLVEAMHWSSVINVMKIDVSTNDVPHDMVNAWDLPSVYYFPAHEKDQPIELSPIRNDSDPQQSYDEGLTWVSCGYDIVKWMVDQGKLNLEDLQRLDLDGS